jgi:hypothetical protein
MVDIHCSDNPTRVTFSFALVGTKRISWIMIKLHKFRAMSEGFQGSECRSWADRPIKLRISGTSRAPVRQMLCTVVTLHKTGRKRSRSNREVRLPKSFWKKLPIVSRWWTAPLARGAIQLQETSSRQVVQNNIMAPPGLCPARHYVTERGFTITHPRGRLFDDIHVCARVLSRKP